MLRRPTIPSEEVFDKLFDRFLYSELTLQELCAKHDDLPTYPTVLAWLKHYPEFARQYAVTMDSAQEIAAEEMCVIARGLPMDMYIDNKFRIKSTPGAIRHTKAVLKYRRWLLSAECLRNIDGMDCLNCYLFNY